MEPPRGALLTAAESLAELGRLTLARAGHPARSPEELARIAEAL